jgi:hypothetical protein
MMRNNIEKNIIYSSIIAKNRKKTKNVLKKAAHYFLKGDKHTPSIVMSTTCCRDRTSSERRQGTQIEPNGGIPVREDTGKKDATTKSHPSSINTGNIHWFGNQFRCTKERSN